MDFARRRIDSGGRDPGAPAFGRMRVLVALGMVFAIACQPTAGPQATGAPAATKLTFAQPSAIDTLDPQRASTATAYGVLINVHEGLITRDPKTMQPVPSLAASYTNPDPTTWIFKLRSGVKFQNGEPFDAQVVKFGLDRIVKPELKSATGAVLQPILDKVEVQDDLTVRITTKVPAPWLLERFARVWFVPPKETAEKGDDYVAGHPVGTGPYKLVEWVPGQRVALTRNEEYWGPKPAYKDLVFREIQESATAISELVAGSVDIIGFVPADQVEAIDRSSAAKVRSTETQVVLEVALDAVGRSGPNPLQNKLVRQAVNYAVDRTAIAKNILGGYSRPVATFLSPLIFGYDASIQPYPHDPAQAKRLLTEAGYPDGFDTELKFFPLAFDTKLLAQAISSDLAKIGVRAKLTQIGSSEVGPAIQSGKAGPMFILMVESAGSFDAALAFSNLRPGGASTYYTTDRLESLRLQAESTVDANERKRLYSEIQKLMFDDAGKLFGWTGFLLTGVSTKVDWSPSPDGISRLFLAKAK